MKLTFPSEILPFAIIRLFCAILSVLVIVGSAMAQRADPLTRAIDAIGGEAALQRTKSVSVFMIGKRDSKVVDQGYYASKASPQRYQETLVVDTSTNRSALRSEGLNSDGSPNIWRWTTLGDNGFAINLKSGRDMKMDQAAARSKYESLRWMIPQLALAEMSQRREKLRCDQIRGTRSLFEEACEFETEQGRRFRVLFSRRSGHLIGYEYNSRTIRGQKLIRYEFKEYRASSIGLFPAGYHILIGSEVYKDLDVVGARIAHMEDHPWFVPLSPDSKPVNTIAQLEPGATEEVAPGVWFIRNLGGQNTMLVRSGDCAIVFDTPGHPGYGGFGSPIPVAEREPDFSRTLKQRVRELTGKKVCYVVPTHHHYDHIAGIADFVRDGATVVVPAGSVALVREMVNAAGVPTPVKIQIVRERLTLGTGAERIDIRVIRNDPHAEAMVIAHLPAHRIVFEGDMSDYLPSAWNFLRFVEAHKLNIERVFSAHSRRALGLKDIQGEEPEN